MNFVFIRDNDSKGFKDHPCLTTTDGNSPDISLSVITLYVCKHFDEVIGMLI